MSDASVEQAAKALEAARTSYDRIHEDAERQRKLETEALNRLNSAQKAFDDAVAALRKTAPQGSDWERQAYIRGA